MNYWFTNIKIRKALKSCKYCLYCYFTIIQSYLLLLLCNNLKVIAYVFAL